MTIFAVITPLNPATGLRETIRASSSGRRGENSYAGDKYWPAITKAPTTSLRVFDGDFSSTVQTGSASFDISLTSLADEYPGIENHRWAASDVTLTYVDQAGNDELIFVGKISQFGEKNGVLAITAEVDEEPFKADVLSASYAGTGDIEGDANIKDNPKPLILGRAKNVQPVQINIVDNIFQVSSYGPVQAISAVYERGAAFGASLGDYANYAALLAADIPEGRWATCLASGLFRLGAPPFGVITADVDGLVRSAVWLRRTGAIIKALAEMAGASAPQIDSTSFDALDTAVPYNVNIVISGQIDVLSVAQRMALPCNAQVGIDLLGRIFVTRVNIGSPVMILNGEGKNLPGVVDIAESSVRPPFKRIVMGADRSWRVHSFDEIAFYTQLRDRGDWDIATIYREGDIVDQPDGSRWVYINAVPSAGTEPGTDIAVWEEVSAAFAGALSAYITNEAHVVSADSSGTVVTFAGAGGTFVIEDSNGDPVSGYDFSVVSETGVDVSIDIVTGVYTVSSMSADSGVAVLRAEAGALAFERSYSIAKAKAGATNVSGYLTNESHTVAANSAGTVTSLTGSGGTFILFNGFAQVGPGGAVFSVLSSSGVSISINSSTGAYTISAVSADTGTAVLRAVYNGVTIDKAYTISKSRAGAVGIDGDPGDPGANAKTLTLISDRQTIFYLANGSPAPSTQTVQFTTNKQNSTATVSWSVTDAAGVNRTPVTSYLSANSGDSVTMTETQFNNARNSTSGVIVIATISDGGLISDKISIVRVQEGAVGAAGDNGDPGADAKTLTLLSDRQTIYYNAAGAADPGTQTTTFSTNKQNTTATVNWTIADATGTNRTPVTSFLSSATGNSVTMTATQFNSARNGTSGVIVTATLTDGTTISDKISIVRVQEGAVGGTGADAVTLTLISNRQSVHYDENGDADPTTQTTTFDALKQNTASAITFTIKDAAGNTRSPSTYLSGSGDSRTMTEGQFDGARNGTSGVVVTAELSSTPAITDSISVVRTQDGTPGTDGDPGADAKLLTLRSSSTSFTYNGAGTATPSSQTIDMTAQLENLSGSTSWSATAYNSSGSVLGAITMSGSGNARSMTNTQFMAPGATAFAVIQVTLGGYSATMTIVKVQDGAPGGTGAAGIAAFLSNDAFVVQAFADGTVQSYSGATGEFKIFSGGTDISTNFTLSTFANPQSLTIGYSGRTYTVTGGLDPGEDTANITIRATGSGSYSGIVIDRIFSLGKLKGGYEIVATLPTTSNFTGRMVFLTTDGKLYRYTSGAWTKAVDGADIQANSILTNSIAAGQITAAKLATTELITLSAQIGSGVITNAKIGNLEVDSAKIANLTVGTGKITDNAVSQVLTAYTSGTLGSTVSVSDTITAQTVAITSTGAPILINGIFVLRFLSLVGAASPCKTHAVISLKANGSTGLLSQTCEIVSLGAGDDVTIPIALGRVWTPAAGTYTFTIEVLILDGTTEFFSASDRSLTVMELKK